MSEVIFNKILEQLNNLSNIQQETNNGIGSLDNKVSSLDAKLDVIEKQVGLNTEKLNTITEEQKQIKQATIDTKEEIHSLKDEQERQDKILESLSLRSLEQETDIRALKRII